ncbi:MAG TPA: nucleoside phosphorylase [Sphingobacteriaceae bacterium]
MNRISETDLILNPDGSIYHLNLLPEDLAETIITVGDPDRVEEVSKHFDRIDIRKGKREFITHTGFIGNKRISVVSTGIGTDNIDIVLNELDALINVDFAERIPKPHHVSLDIIRVGTSGTIQPDIPIDTILVSELAVGLDALMHYYVQDQSTIETGLQTAIRSHLNIDEISAYVSESSGKLLERFGTGLTKGITTTAPGFYAPQGRQVRAKNKVSELIGKLSSFRYQDHRITNLEMETAGIYALAKALGHHALSVNAILASRVDLRFSTHPQKVVEQAILHVLSNIT